MQDDVRWVQRFQNLTRAFHFLKAALDQKHLNPLERTGVIQAYQYALVDDGDLWMDMLEKRNLMAHSYDEERALTALDLIRHQYAPQFERLVEELSKKSVPHG